MWKLSPHWLAQTFLASLASNTLKPYDLVHRLGSWRLYRCFWSAFAGCIHRVVLTTWSFINSVFLSLEFDSRYWVSMTFQALRNRLADRHTLDDIKLYCHLGVDSWGEMDGLVRGSRFEVRMGHDFLDLVMDTLTKGSKAGSRHRTTPMIIFWRHSKPEAAFSSLFLVICLRVGSLMSASVLCVRPLPKSPRLWSVDRR